MQEGGGGERSDRRQAELGRLLAVAGGYRVLMSDGTCLGWLDHVRYVRHADHPDEIFVRRRRPSVTGSVSLDGWGSIAGLPAARRAGGYR